MLSRVCDSMRILNHRFQSHCIVKNKAKNQKEMNKKNTHTQKSRNILTLYSHAHFDETNQSTAFDMDSSKLLSIEILWSINLIIFKSNVYE